MHCLKLDRGELGEGALATPAVIRPFDPDDAVAEELNNSPRRILDWQTPSELLIASGAMIT